MEQGSKVVQILVALSVSLASVTMGVSSAWPTPVILMLSKNQTSIEIDMNEIAWMLAMSSPGFMVGSLATQFLSDNCGRRATILGSALPIALGTVIVAFAVKAWLLYITRFLWGCGTGMLSIVMSLYIAEIAHKDIRGTLAVVTKFMFNFGSLLVLSIGPFVSYETLNYMLLILPLCYLVACWWIPESPYYYLKQGRVASARKELMKLRRYKDDKALDDELIILQAEVRNDMRRSSSAKELLTGPHYRKAIIIAAGLKLTQVMTGILAIQQYLGKIMEESKAEMSLPVVYIVFGAVRFVVGIMSSVLADRVGRRPLLIYSYLGTAVSHAIVGIYFFLREIIEVPTESLRNYGFVTFVGIISSNVISTLGFNSIIVVIPAEIFPLNVKAVALTSLSIFGGVLGFSVSRGYQALKDVWGLSGVFWVFATVSLFGAVFTYFTVPETKGKSLKEIQVLLQGDLYVDDVEGKKLNDVQVEGEELREMKVKDDKAT